MEIRLFLISQMNNFTKNFTTYDFPKLGFIRIPKIYPKDIELKRFNLSKDCSSTDFLYSLAKEGFSYWQKSGKIQANQEKLYWSRLEHEIKEITKLHFTDYILMVYRIIEYCKNNKILTSPARGSCGGSLLLAIIGVTQKLDPIKMDLLFERFVSAARTEIKEFDGELYMSSDALPDIDLDINQRFKSNVFQFLEILFPKKVAHIANISTLQSKVLLKEVLKTYNNFLEDETKHISNLIETKFGKVEEINEALKENKPFIEWAKEFSDTVDICKKLSLLIKNKSVHAAGIILCNEDIVDSIPLELSSDKRVVTGYTMEDSQKFGIKVDILSLKNLDAIQNTLDLIGKTMDDIDINDKSIYKFINKSNDFYGVFQAEESIGKVVLKQIKPQKIDDIGVSIALGRPGCMSLIDDYLKFDPKNLKQIDERVKPTLIKNKNCIIFQETVMELAKIMANFTPQESDGLRKGIGKKIVEKILQYKDKFIDNSLKNGYDKDFILWCWTIFEASGNYSFNRSHAMGYGTLTAICAWLKGNYPLEYFVSLLNSAKNEQDPLSEISKIQAELINFKIKMLPPNIIKSDLGFKIEGQDIRMGVGEIKGIAGKNIEKLQKFKHEYSNKFDIMNAAHDNKIPINILVNIIITGGFDDMLSKNSRAITMLESCLWNILTIKEKLWVMKLGKEFNYDLIEIIKALNEKIRDEKGKFIIKDSRRITIRKNLQPFMEVYNYNKKNSEIFSYIAERELLGFSYSTNLHKIYKPQVENLVTISEILGDLPDTKVKFVSEIVEVKKGTTKNGNQKVQIRAKDHTGEIRVMLFNTDYNMGITKSKEASGRDFKDGDVIICEGKKKDGNCVFGELVTAQKIDVFLKISQLPKDKLNE